VMIEAELALPAMLAVFVAVTASLMGGACTLAVGGDARSRRLFPREVRDRRTGMIIRIGNVDEMVRVHPNLEEVGEAAVGTAQQAAGRDLTRVVGVVGSLSERENRRNRMA